MQWYRIARLDQFKSMRGQDGTAVGEESAIGDITFNDPGPIAQAAIGKADHVLLIGSEQRCFDDLPDATKIGMFVLRAGQRAQVERGQVTRMCGLDPECLANGESQFGTNQTIVEQPAFEPLTHLVDRFGIAGQQPRDNQHRAAEQACIRFQVGQRQLSVMCAERDDIASFSAARQAFECFGKRCM